MPAPFGGCGSVRVHPKPFDSNGVEHRRGLCYTTHCVYHMRPHHPPASVEDLLERALRLSFGDRCPFSFSWVWDGVEGGRNLVPERASAR